MQVHTIKHNLPAQLLLICKQQILHVKFKCIYQSLNKSYFSVVVYDDYGNNSAQPAAFPMLFKISPKVLLALLIETLLVECDVRTVTPLPATLKI